jgi:hypothetical protein
MGVHDFFKIATSAGTIADAGVEFTLEQLEGERLAVDASYITYNAILAFQAINTLSDASGRPTGHISTILSKVIQMDRAGIDQLWIFDSADSNPIKEAERKRRADKRTQAAAAGKSKSAFVLTSEIVNEVKTLLNLLGVAWLEAPPGIEGEQYGAFLSSGPRDQRFCRAMLSGDSDVVMFGGTLLRIIPGKVTKYIEYDHADVLKATELTRNQLVEMGCHMGTDFNDKTPRVGPMTVLKSLKAGKLALTDSQKKAYQYFMQSCSNVKIDIKQEDYNLERLLEFLKERDFQVETQRKRLANYRQ